MKPVTRRRIRSGFTLVELLVVCAIIGILARIAIPRFMDVRTRAQATAIIGELRVIHDAAYSYYADTQVWPPNTAVGRMPRELAPYLPGSLQQFKRSSNYSYVWFVRGARPGNRNRAPTPALMGVGVSTSDKALFAQVQKVLGDTPSYVSGKVVYALISGPGLEP